MDNTVLFIVADEKTNAGERDYMKALSIVVNRAKISGTDYQIRKIGEANGQEDESFGTVLPQNDADYAKVPRLTQEYVRMLKDNLAIVAVGYSTFPGLMAALETIDNTEGTIVSDLAYITHMVDAKDEENLSFFGIDVFAPLSGPKNYPLHTIDAVPHTNSRSSCEADYEMFLKDGRYKEWHAILHDNEPFIFVVLNAGFDVVDMNGQKERVPYTESEAAEQGYALADYLPAGTNLFLVDGGPRNLMDENQGQKTMDSFIEGYSRRQNAEGAGRILAERFRQGQPFNIIKAGYMMAQLDSCAGYISNSEGYGTMDGAILHVDNNNKLVGMFPFAAQYADSAKTRVGNIEKYNRLGIANLRVFEGSLEITRQPDEQKTPVLQKDAAVEIAGRLGLIASVPVFQPVPPEPHI